MQLSSIIVMLSRASPQSDAQHDGRAATSNGSIMSWPPDARQSSCSISALTVHRHFQLRSDQSIKQRKKKHDESQVISHGIVFGCVAKHRRVAEIEGSHSICVLRPYSCHAFRSIISHYELRMCLIQIQTWFPLEDSTL